MTKRELDNINKKVRKSRSRYWSDRSLNDKALEATPAIRDRFIALLHNRLQALRFKYLKSKDQRFLNYIKAKDYALVGPKGVLP